jgi:hypothetical protein
MSKFAMISGWVGPLALLSCVACSGADGMEFSEADPNGTPADEALSYQVGSAGDEALGGVAQPIPEASQSERSDSVGDEAFGGVELPYDASHPVRSRGTPQGTRCGGSVCPPDMPLCLMLATGAWVCAPE